MRHWIACCAFATAVLAGLAALDQLGRRTAAPGAIWVVARGEPGTLLAGLTAGADVRILNAWGGGRILLLHAPSLAAASLPHDAAWITLHISPAGLPLPACG